MRARLTSIRDYEVLRSVITSGSASAAARRLGVSQPAISRTLSGLEARLGLTLFERRGGRLQPTAEAMRLNGQLDRLFDALALIEQTDPTDPSSQPLRLAAPPSLAHRFLGSCIAGFMRLNPGQAVSLEACTSNGLVSRLVEDTIDLGFTHADLTNSAMELIPFYQTNAVCVMPRRHPLAAHQVITPELLDGQPLIALMRRHMVRTRLDRIFADAGVSPRRVAEVATGVSAVTLAREGIGLSVVCPFPVLRPDDDSVEVRPFRPAFVYRTSFAVSTVRPLSRVARAFMRHVRMVVRSEPYASTVAQLPDTTLPDTTLPDATLPAPAPA